MSQCVGVDKHADMDIYIIYIYMGMCVGACMDILHFCVYVYL